MEENNQLNPFQKYIQENSVLITIFVVLQLFIIILAIFIFNKLNESPTKIPNYTISSIRSIIKDLPNESIDPIQISLYNIARENGVSDIGKDDIIIRGDSVVNLYFKDQNMHYVNFIADVPSKQQTYQLFHEWSDDSNNRYYLINRATMAMCPTSEDTLYDDFECKDSYAYNGQRAIAAEFIKYYFFDAFTPFLNVEDLYKTIYINPVATTITDEETDSFIKQTKDAINELGISPELFEYKILSSEDMDFILPASEYAE